MCVLLIGLNQGSQSTLLNRDELLLVAEALTAEAAEPSHAAVLQAFGNHTIRVAIVADLVHFVRQRSHVSASEISDEIQKLQLQVDTALENVDDLEIEKAALRKECEDLRKTNSALQDTVHGLQVRLRITYYFYSPQVSIRM